MLDAAGMAGGFGATKQQKPSTRKCGEDSKTECIMRATAGGGG